jgi:Sulfotransferase family
MSLVDAESSQANGDRTSRFPDFIIGGAMKSGTSTLRHLLSQCADVFFPDRELHFFCLDDITQHPDYVGPVDGRWISLDFERDFDTNVRWYCDHFARARPSQLKGEHSTVYLASEKASERIARLLPSVKLIFLLRDPVARTYSHYWHVVRTGMAVYDFERTLRYSPNALLTRSFYKPQVEAYLKRFPRENLKFMVFEKFIDNLKDSMAEVGRFLGLQSKMDLTKADTHRHPGHRPRSLRVQLATNRLLRDAISLQHLPDLPGVPTQRPGGLVTLIDRAIRRANQTTYKYPEMRPETRAFLQDLFARENAGLSELIGVELHSYWPYLTKVSGALDLAIAASIDEATSRHR